MSSLILPSVSLYAINNVYPSIQGEGCQTGVPMVILRLQGCAVGCPWCDTKETWKFDAHTLRVTPPEVFNEDGTPSHHWIILAASEMAAYIRRKYSNLLWVLLTGGEPADQDLEALVNALHDAGFRVALETSGTATGFFSALPDWVCVSPKIEMPGGRAVLPEVMATADEIKYVIGKRDDLFKLDALLASCPTLKEGVQICLQPVSQSAKATALCLETCMSRGWRLSIQTHKFISLP